MGRLPHNRNIMAGIVRNTFVNISTFVINGVLGLALVPILVSAYGMSTFGLIVLARNLLPGGAVSIFDLGIPESTTRYTASLAKTDPRAVKGAIVSAALLASGLGGLVAVAIFATMGPLMTTLFRVPSEASDSFGTAACVCAAALPLLFPAEALKSALMGFERFDAVRMGETASTLLYVMGAAGLAYAGIDFRWVIVLFVLTLAGRVAYFLPVLVAHVARRAALAEGKWRPGPVRPLVRLGFALFQAKCLGLAFNQGPGLLIASFAGPAAAGSYDVLMRLPRLTKAISGLLNSALMPFAARTAAAHNNSQAKRVVLSGTLIAVLLVVPPSFGLAVMGRDVFVAWLGPNFQSYATWLAFGMVWTILNAWNGIGGTMLSASYEAVHKMNVITLARLVMFIGIAFAPPFRDDMPGAFLVATVLSALLASPFSSYLVVKQYGLTAWQYVSPLARALAPGVILAGVWYGGGLAHVDAGLLSLAVRLGAWCLTYWTILYLVGVSAEERSELHLVLWRLIGRAPAASA